MTDRTQTFKLLHAMTNISVDIQAYLADCYEDISEAEREQLATLIASKFDYTQVYDTLDELVDTFRK